MAHENGGKSKGFYISKLVTDSAEDHNLTAGFAKKVAEMQTGSRAMQTALQGTEKINAIEQMAKALDPYSGIKEQFNTVAGAGYLAQFTAQQDMMNSLLPVVWRREKRFLRSIGQLWPMPRRRQISIGVWPPWQQLSIF